VSSDSEPQRGDVWLVNFDPTLGSEIRKVRPAVVLSSDALGKLPLKLVAPVTEWKAHFSGNLWHVRLEPNAMNGLAKSSAVDALQLRSVDAQRFLRRMGRVSPVVMNEITLAVAAVIEYP
jgi:mRNA interferase MazF